MGLVGDDDVVGCIYTNTSRLEGRGSARLRRVAGAFFVLLGCGHPGG